MNSSPWKILLIDDLPMYANLLDGLLAPIGAKIDCVGSLAEGIKQANQVEYDVILLDLGLPDSQGLDTYQTLSNQYDRIPIVIFSNADDEQIAIRAVQQGAQDYLLKGVHLVQGDTSRKLIIHSISYAIERHRIRNEIILERDSLEEKIQERTKDLQRANARLRLLTKSLVSAQENERRRISLELHDEAGQILTALQLNLKILQKEITGLSTEQAAQLEEATQLTDVIITKLRTLARNLRAPALDAVGLHQAMKDYCMQIDMKSGIQVKYYGDDINHLPEYIQISLYRMLQEAFTNILKHAHATKVEVNLIHDIEMVSLKISDNGVGFTLQNPTMANQVEGIGLLGLHDRIEALGGKLSIDSNPGKGTEISATIPILEAG